MLNSYKKLNQITWANTSCVICGAGPSLINYSFKNYNNLHFISVNSSIIKMPWELAGRAGFLRAWISNDSLCRRWDYFEKVISDKCEKIVRDSWLKYSNELPNFLYFSPRSSKEEIILENDDGLLYNSSVPTAVDLAIKLGFKRIILLGIDHKCYEGATHFWELMPFEKQPKEKVNSKGSKMLIPPNRIRQPLEIQKNVWSMNIEVFKSLKKHAESKGIEILNVQECDSDLPFAKISFKESELEKYGVKFMSICKYT